MNSGLYLYLGPYIIIYTNVDGAMELAHALVNATELCFAIKEDLPEASAFILTLGLNKEIPGVYSGLFDGGPYSSLAESDKEITSETILMSIQKFKRSVIDAYPQLRYAHADFEFGVVLGRS